MSYKTISTDYFSSDWFLFNYNPVYGTGKISAENYKTLGSFSQATNWEKVFALGDQINKELKMTEQQIIDDVVGFRKQKSE